MKLDPVANQSVWICVGCTGGRGGFAMDVLEWLLKRGAQHVTVAGSGGTYGDNKDNVYENGRRFAFLEKYYSATIGVAPAAERPDNPARASALLQRAKAVKAIGAIFILPMVSLLFSTSTILKAGEERKERIQNLRDRLAE